MRSTLERARRVLAFAAGLATPCASLGCGSPLDVGSDVLWSARFEGNDFSEWTSVPGGGVLTFPMPPNVAETTTEKARAGRYAAKLTVDAAPGGGQQSIDLIRKGGLPTEAYYSAWYYLPLSAQIGSFWVISKFRMRTSAGDAATEGELFDLDLHNLPNGEMSVVLYDHRSGELVPLDVTDPIVPVGVWFHLEAFYRNANDSTGRLTYWIDGRQIIDLRGPTAPSPWTEWDVSSVAVDLTPSQQVLFVDDCAISLSRVGPTGVIAR